jgi:squalene synthase HpnC
MMLLAGGRTASPAAGAVMARARAENFPVASRVLPRRARRHLLAVYGFARLVDEVGDAAQGDRLGQLDAIEAELDRAFAGRATHPLLVALQPTLRECALERDPFARLIEANRVDQRVHRYATWEQLRGYCSLSADPVGEIVLDVFGVATPERVRLSDSICTALQLAEHCQDVAEDLRAGRIYLPAREMARFGCREEDLAPPPRGAQDPPPRSLVELLAFEVSRARELLDAGRPLLGQLRGRLRFAVAAFVAGGEAALDAIEQAGYDVRFGAPRATRARRALSLAAELAGRHHAGR